MLTIKRGILGLSLLLLGAFSVVEAQPLTFEEHGFRIVSQEAFRIYSAEARPLPSGAQQVLTLLLPASEGFAPNINVQIQPFAGTLEDYTALSHRQFKAMGLTLQEEQKGDNTVTWAFKGPWKEQQMQWYARAIKPSAGNKVYLVTGTALQTQWPRVQTQLKHCVESLELLPSEPSERSDSDAAR